MKYGYSPLTFNYVIGKLGLDGLTLPDKSISLTNVAQEAFKLGFKSIELDMDMFQILSMSVQQDDLVSLGEFCENTGFGLSCHMPYYSLDIAGPNEHIRKGSVQALVRAYHDIKYLDPHISRYVIHPMGEITAEVINFFPSEFTDNIVKLFREYSRISLESFLDETRISREKTVLENIRFPLKETVELVQETGTRFCLDTAHLLGGLSGEHVLMEVLTSYYDLIGEIHLQEFDPETEHTAVGAYGRIASSFFEFIYDKGFSGPVVFELPMEAVKASTEYIRNIFPSASADLPFFP